MGLLADPLNEPPDIRVREKGFHSVVLTFERLVVKGGVYVPVARTTEVYGAVDLLTVEHFLVALVLVARSGDEVVACEVYGRPATELAGPFPRAFPLLIHNLMLTPTSPPPCESQQHLLFVTVER